MRVNLIDTQFAHGTSFGAGDLKIYPASFQWDRSLSSNSKHIFITEDSFDNPILLSIPKERKVALILEPNSINPYAYLKARDRQNEFRYILTHDKEFARHVPNALYYCFGGCWINPSDRMIHNKTKLISIIASEKKTTIGHQMRHDIIKMFPGKIDVYGRGYNQIENKVEALADYAYSVIIENESSKGWFTEKLIDCLSCGTIPIYYGAPDIHDYFGGIRGFMDIKGLSELLSFEEQSPGFGFRFYKSMHENVKSLLNLSRQYACPEDYIFNNYNFLFI